MRWATVHGFKLAEFSGERFARGTSEWFNVTLLRWKIYIHCCTSIWHLVTAQIKDRGCLERRLALEKLWPRVRTVSSHNTWCKGLTSPRRESLIYGLPGRGETATYPLPERKTLPRSVIPIGSSFILNSENEILITQSAGEQIKRWKRCVFSWNEMEEPNHCMSYHHTSILVDRQKFWWQYAIERIQYEMSVRIAWIILFLFYEFTAWCRYLHHVGIVCTSMYMR